MNYPCEIGARQAETEGCPVMRMVVVDDEPRQRKGLVELIRRLRAEDEVLAMKDGEQVLQYVRDKEVDIVFSDIRMPRMNGLELSKELLAARPDMIVILVSVYADFEYARKALELGAFGYLLKPIAVDELKRILEKAVEKRLERREQAFSTDREKLASALGVYQEHLLRKWLGGEIGEEELEGYLPEYRRGYLLDVALPVMEEKGIREELGENMTLWLKQYFCTAQVFPFWEDRNGNILTALILLTDEWSDFRMTAERFLRSMKREYGEEVSVLVSKGFRAGAELADIWTEFQQTAEMLFYGPYGQVINPENRSVYREYQNSGIMELSRDIRASLLSGEEGRGQAELNAYLALPEDGSVVRPDVLKEMTVNLFLQILEGLGEFLEKEERGGLVEECLKLKGCTGYRNLKEESSALLERIREAAGRGQLCLSPMQQAVRYIEEHYMQDLSLNTLAERYHYSPNYFSSTFKAFTGENLISYVNRLRMEKAVEYMSVQGMKNQEIACRVGIADYKYFNKLFKRHYGMSVQEYRSRLLKERKEGNGT